MQAGLAITHGLASFGPYLCFHTTAADCSGGLAIFEKQHLGAASLWRGTASVRHCCDNNPLAARVRFINQAIKIVLWDRAHTSVSRKIISTTELATAWATDLDFLQLPPISFSRFASVPFQHRPGVFGGA